MYATHRQRQHTTLDVVSAYLRRLLALAAYAAAVAALYVAVSPVLPAHLLPWQEGARPAVAEPAALPPRPVAAPALIPGWAWDMHAWHSTEPGSRGARPAEAPRRLPAWYWEWRKWRLALSR